MLKHLRVVWLNYTAKELMRFEHTNRIVELICQSQSFPGPFPPTFSCGGKKPWGRGWSQILPPAWEPWWNIYETIIFRIGLFMRAKKYLWHNYWKVALRWTQHKLIYSNLKSAQKPIYILNTIFDSKLYLIQFQNLISVFVYKIFR
jgi:hypothetical protein